MALDGINILLVIIIIHLLFECVKLITNVKYSPLCTDGNYSVPLATLRYHDVTSQCDVTALS